MVNEQKGRPVGVVMQNSEIIPPQNNVLEYLVVRDEDVSVVQMGGFDFKFKKNEHGHKVCHVSNKGARTLMLETGNFREYVPPEVAPETEAEVFVKTWDKIRGEKFTTMVIEDPDRFAAFGDEVLEKAKKKWEKFNGDKPWPGDVPPEE